MGLTFRLAGSYRPSKIPGPCPACHVAAHEGRGHDCGACQGYGGDTEEQTRQEVARSLQEVDAGIAVAAIVLRWLGRADDYAGGEMDAAMVLVALACAWPAGDVVAASTTRGVHLTADGVGPGAEWNDCGIDSDRLRRIHERMTALAERAAAAGVAVEWL